MNNNQNKEMSQWYNNKGRNKLKFNKNSILFDLSKSPKFSSAVVSKSKYISEKTTNNTSSFNIKYSNTIDNKNYSSNSYSFPPINSNNKKSNNITNNNNSELFLYVGMTNGSILSINLKHNKNIMSNQTEEVTMLKCNEQFKHKGNVNVLIFSHLFFF